VSQHPLIDAARHVVATVLEPAAAEVDASVVPKSHLKSLADAGLLGVLAPVEVGGAGASAAVFREVAEQLAGADAATWFVQAQHHAPVRLLTANPSAAADRYLPALATGELVAGIAFSHLRQYPKRPVTATREAAGWRFNGVAPWYTGWGINDVAFLSGVDDAGEVVFAVVPAAETDALTVRARLRTAALNASQTVMLAIDDLVVSSDEIALQQPHADWAAADLIQANANAAIFGLGASAIALLRAAGEARQEAASVDAAAMYQARLDMLRTRCYALADDVPAHEAIDERLDLRAQALELLIAITSGLVAASGGSAMALSSPAQRKAREALFLLVQAQTAPARIATMRRWASSAAGWAQTGA